MARPLSKSKPGKGSKEGMRVKARRISIKRGMARQKKRTSARHCKQGPLSVFMQGD